MRTITRREFIQLTATSIGAISASEAWFHPHAIAADTADTVLINGNILTVDQSDSVVNAVAIRDGKILRAGSNDEVSRYIGNATQMIDLEGKTVTPGLVDSHIHVMYYGQQFHPQLLNVRYPLTPNKEALLKLVADRAKIIRPGEWIVGNHGFMLILEMTPNRWELDQVAPNNPVFLKVNSGQHAVANSLALKMAGVNRGTPNPPGAKIGRDPVTKEPNGLLFHYPAQQLVARVAPVYSGRGVEGLVEDVYRGQVRCLAAGYTSGHDVIIFGNSIGGYYEAASRNGLKMRIRLMEYVESEENAIQVLRKRRPSNHPLLTVGGYKLAVDGGLGSKTMLMHNGSLEGAKLAYLYHEPAALSRMTRLFHREGHQVAFHATGDRAIDLAIDAIENALQAQPRAEHRHRIEHCLFPTERALERIKSLGIVVSVSPQWNSFHADVWRKLTDEPTMQRMVPLKTMKEMGIKVAFGCDVPATIMVEPRWAFMGAVHRTTRSGYAPGPAERITTADALRMHTMGSAYAGFEEKEKGSLETGKLADLVVWSHDLYKCSVQELRELNPMQIMVGGQFISTASVLRQ